MSDQLADLLARGDRKILFVGVGNVLKQDDGVGVYISNRLQEKKNIRIVTPEVSIENYIGKINSTDHDTLVIIDCADIGKPPGSYDLLPLSRISDMTTNTHNISLRKLAEFFSSEVFVLAIQPEKIAFGEKLSYIVEATANKIIELINKQGG